MRPDLPTPAPAVEPETEPYWRAARQGRLMLTRCTVGGEIVWIPRPFCPSHMDAATEWVQASGRGVIYSYTEVNRGEGDYAAATPYVLAYVELAEGPRIMTNIVDAAGQELGVGQAVEVVFHPAGDDLAVPRFRPVAVSEPPR